jgi:hypothetical protein
MDIVFGIILSLLSCAAMFCGWQWYAWRKSALSAMQPRDTAVTAETQYKDSYQAAINALDEERRQIDVAMNEVFDVLNEEAHETDDPRMMQCRNILLRAIQISTYGRGK